METRKVAREWYPRTLFLVLTSPLIPGVPILASPSIPRAFILAWRMTLGDMIQSVRMVIQGNGQLPKIAQVINDILSAAYVKGHQLAKTTMSPMAVTSLTTSSKAMGAVETKEVKQSKLMTEKVCHKTEKNHLPSTVHVKKNRRVKRTMRRKAVVSMTTRPEAMLLTNTTEVTLMRTKMEVIRIGIQVLEDRDGLHGWHQES